MGGRELGLIYCMLDDFVVNLLLVLAMLLPLIEGNLELSAS